MVRASSSRKRKRPIITDSEHDFLASPKHAASSPNRIGWESPSEDSSHKTNKVCSLSETVIPSKRQSSLLNFFSKSAKAKPQKDSGENDENKGGSQKTSNTNSSFVFRSSVAPKKPKKSLTQFYLDCGQKSFGQVLCKKCGTLYVPGVSEDEAEHKKLCDAFALGIPCLRGIVRGGKKLWTTTTTTTTTTTIPEKRNADASIVSWRPCVKKLRDANHHQYDDNDQPSQWPLLAKMISKDLGTHQETTLQHLKREIVFLYILKQQQQQQQQDKKHRILGVATVQVLGNIPAYEMLGPSERSLQPIRAKLGIGLLWTHPSHRQKGIARQLVDLARQHSCFGTRIPKRDLAFSNPTTAGYKFAIRYYGKDRETPLVYEMAL